MLLELSSFIFADVNTWPSFLFHVIQSLCSQFYFTTQQGVISIATSSLVTVCDHNTRKARTSSEDQIELMPMLRSWMSPGNSVF